MRNTTRTETTRALLLQAARHEFAEHGIAGARVDRIAERAGVNKQRIYAHFGDKEQLFRYVVVKALNELSKAVTVTDDQDPAAYVARVFDYHRAHPDLLRLLLWESLHYGNARLPAEEERAELYDAKAASLSDALSVDTEVSDTRQLLLTLIGLAVWPQIAPQIARLVLGPDAASDTEQERLREFLVDFTRTALGHPPAATDPADT
ncbi:TetR family transcriptional regulator [Nocardiopsis sp. EMB25]|uniref:TetR/AcrR family transcriptional regulator n=1 Tax=Nocardiopsis TaxID=2013 RepID=UPI00034D9CAA|nr:MULTISPECIES: TetR family transcriptional regulator [Nocardiopsis]MCY9782407.1 TetR family transcriptional regulator [Nocardiopsis sp. EMB25]